MTQDLGRPPGATSRVQPNIIGNAGYNVQQQRSSTGTLSPVVSPSLIDSMFVEMKRVIVGQDHLLERLLVALLARGHVLIEGVPGLAKTLTIKSLAQVMGGTFGRVQFTPDLVPADVTGTRIYNAKTGEFVIEPGPIFVNVLLADEINRAPAKVQSSLLEVMQERQVTIGKQTMNVPNPFFVLATQNPIDSDGTYPLPEAQLDRFLFKILVDYPSYNEELVIIDRAMAGTVQLNPLLVPGQMVAMQQTVDQVYVDAIVKDYAVKLVAVTREPEKYGLKQLAPWIQYGASPRASVGLIIGARALAFVRKRHYVVPQDVADLLPEVLRHRLVLSYDAIADNISPEQVTDIVLKQFPAERLDLGDKQAP